MSQPYGAALSHVFNRGRPSVAFLDELVAWAKTAQDEIFAPNTNPADIYAVIKPYLASTGTVAVPFKWDNLLHRKAAMIEVMRVHAGMESSWNWNEGVDVTNANSMRRLTGQETGIFQVSFDSLNLGGGALKDFAVTHDIWIAEEFISRMKTDHDLALEYYARLVRVSIKWAGPLLRHGEDSIFPWLRRASVTEFMGLLS